MSSNVPLIDIDIGGQKLQVPQLSSFALHVTVHIDPKNIDAFLAAFREPYEGCLATPELQSFEFFQDPVQPGTLSWVEVWNANTEWFFAVQFKKDYYLPYLQVTEPMFVKPREFRILQRVDLSGK